MFKKVFTLNFVLILLTIIAAIYLISHLIWFFERRVNHEQWPAEYKKGIGESIWFTITTMLVGGTDNKGPIGFGGRFVTMLWMLFSSILISFFTATFTTTMTINKLNSNEINGPEDLPGIKVATIKGSYSENLLNEKDADIKSYDNIKDCIKALREKQVKAIVYDAPVLQYELKSLADDQFQLVGPVFSKQYYAFPIKKDRALLEEINKALLSSSESGVLSELKEKYFNTDN
jgi:ABC-type amino acid transport substrate-binding protein